MLNFQNKNIFTFWNQRRFLRLWNKNTLPYKFLYTKKVLYYHNINKVFQRIPTCPLNGRQRGYLKKIKLNRHVPRNQWNFLFNHWEIRTW